MLDNSHTYFELASSFPGSCIYVHCSIKDWEWSLGTRLILTYTLYSVIPLTRLAKETTLVTFLGTVVYSIKSPFLSTHASTFHTKQ